MKPSVASVSVLAIVLLNLNAAPAGAVEVNPIEKVVQLISDLQQKVIKEGEEEQKLYDEFAEWCEDESKEKQFEIKTSEGQKEKLTATISKAASDIEDHSTKIEELSSSIATNEADLKAATEIREKERADFEAEEKELLDTVDTLDRAKGILEKEMAKHGSAFLQNGRPIGDNARKLVNVLRNLLDASTISTQDRRRLAALVQTNAVSHQAAQEDEEEDAQTAEEDRLLQMGAPDPAAYKGQSDGIIGVMEDMLEKAEGQLSESRKKEMNSKHNYEMLKQGLEDQIKNSGKNMKKAKKDKAGAEETKATAEGELAVVEKDLAEDTSYLSDVHHDCMTKAADFEASTHSRGEELKALATGKKIIVEKVMGNTGATYSFVQLEAHGKTTSHQGVTAHTRAQTVAAGYRVAKLLRGLAQKNRSIALAQLAMRIEAEVRHGFRSGDDPFAKVKGLIKDMIDRLVKEAEAEASHKEWCDKEMGETKAKKDKLETQVEELTTKIDKMTADIAQLREEVKVLQEELAALAKAEKEMDEIRRKEHDTYVQVKAELEEGIEGITAALKVLRDYYAKKDDAHGKASGAGGGIIGLLEVAESDFTKNLEDVETEEETAQEEYDNIKQENALTKTTKEQDVKYKTKEYKGLEKSVAEAKQDLEGIEAEQSAVLEYYEKLKEQCIAKPEPYEERKKRREAEIEGLKEALAILEGEALIQTGSRRAVLRGVKPHSA